FVERLTEMPAEDAAPEPRVDHLGFGKYRDKPDAWNQIWTYRRIRSTGARPAFGDWSLQNWEYSMKFAEGGNDYPFGYVFKSKAATAAERASWQGGVRTDVLAAAEDRAFAWHAWFKQHAPAPFAANNIVLARDALGTGHGLAKMPYMRDSRRSV